MRIRRQLRFLLALGILFSCFLLSPRVAGAGGPLRAIDVYGSHTLDQATVTKMFGSPIARLATLRGEDEDAYSALRDSLRRELENLPEVCFAQISIVPSYRPPYAVDVTLDIVECQDRPQRMPFRSPPEATATAMPSLCQLWLEYDERGAALFFAGNGGSMACQAFHCLWGFDGELAAYGEKFDDLVPQKTAELRLVLTQHPDPEVRAAAAYLFAHCGDIGVLSEALQASLSDSSYMVRNATMRVLGQAARKHVDKMNLSLPLVIRALNYPTVYDRNKAITLVRFMVDDPADQVILLSEGGDVLLALLALQQSANRGPAYHLLRQLTGADHAKDDVAAWRIEVQKYLARHDTPITK